MSFDFAAPRPVRRPGLTPMIDVVFLILVFFMLAARFSVDTSLPVQVGGGSVADYSGPPRLVDVGEETLALNGVDVTVPEMFATLERLTQAPSDPIILRATDGTTLQAMIDILDALRDEGFTTLVFVE